jgi:HEAT repeat protein
MAAVVAGLASEDPFERRETAGVVERLAREGDPASRRALAAALAGLGGREARLPLSLLAADGDERVRVIARRALLDAGGGDR